MARELARAAQVEAEELKQAIEKIRDPLRATKQLGAILGRRLDALAGFRRGFGPANLNLGAAKLGTDHRRSLLRSTPFLELVRPQLTKLSKVGVGSNKLMSTNIAQLGLGLRAIDPKLFRAPDWVRTLPDPAPWLGRFREQATSFVESFKQALPVNWRELESDEVDRVVELMKREGLSLARAPRPDVIRALLTADGHRDRSTVLTLHREEIIEDIEVVLNDVSRPDLRPVAEAGLEAIRTYRDGHPAPAQTYAAAVIGEVIHGPLGWETFGDVRNVFKDKDPRHDVGYTDFPLFAVGGALVRTLDRFEDAGDGFNRNLTQHRIGSPHSEPNLLMVLMLLAGLIREVERVLHRHDPREEEEAA